MLNWSETRFLLYVCMDVLSLKSYEISGGVENWVAAGDGKVYMTIAKVDVCS